MTAAAEDLAAAATALADVARQARTPLVVVPFASRENVASKARRYLLEGRVAVVHVDGPTVRARVRGDGTTYDVAHDRNGWRCTCPARGRCAHLVAVRLVVEVTP